MASQPTASGVVDVIIAELRATGLQGGPLTDGVWVRLPALYKLLLDGTGSVTLDTRTKAGTVTTAAASYTAGTSDAVQYPYFGDTAYEVRATLGGTATAEII